MNSIKLKPPFLSDSDKTYHESLKEKLNLYSKFLRKSDFQEILNKKDFECVKIVSENILKSIYEYLEGKSGESYKIIDDTLRTQYKDWINISYKLDNEKFLIRIRQSITNYIVEMNYFIFHSHKGKHTASYILPALVFRRFFDGKK